MKFALTLTIIAASTLTACQKFVDTPLPTYSIVPEVVFTKDATAYSALQGAYAILQNSANTFTSNTDLFADDILNPNASGSSQQAQENTYNANTPYSFFSDYYQAIFVVNSLLEGVDKPNGLTAPAIQQIKGESKFVRAFCYFQLTNLYGNPPLVLSTEVAVSAYQGNTPRETIYTAIVNDLKDAYQLVGTDYPSADRARANKAVVSALLAKVYLYTKQWKDAETEATRQITNAAYGLPDDLNTVFIKTSPETIWQLWNATGYSTMALSYIPLNTTSVAARLRAGMLSAFAANDKRKAAWTREGTGNSVGLIYPAKYKKNSTSGGTDEYSIQLRLAEQYLIRAEARAQQDNVTGAMEDVNAVRFRTGLGDAAAANKAEALLRIEEERRIELMTENGNRWFDLNRTGRTTFWLAPIKPTWLARDTIIPYPLTITLANPNLAPTPGY